MDKGVEAGVKRSPRCLACSRNMGSCWPEGQNPLDFVTESVWRKCIEALGEGHTRPLQRQMRVRCTSETTDWTLALRCPLWSPKTLSKSQGCLDPSKSSLSPCTHVLLKGNTTTPASSSRPLGVTSSTASQSLSPVGPPTAVFLDSEPCTHHTHVALFIFSSISLYLDYCHSLYWSPAFIFSFL